MRKMNKKFLKLLSSALAIMLIASSVAVIQAQAASKTKIYKGNFSTPVSSQETTNSARISVRFTSRTYVQDCGCFISTNPNMLPTNLNFRFVAESPGRYVSKGTELYYSSTSTKPITGLKSGTKYYYFFFYTDKSGNFYVSDTMWFITKPESKKTTTRSTVNNSQESNNNRNPNYYSNSRDYRNSMKYLIIKDNYGANFYEGKPHYGTIKEHSLTSSIGNCAVLSTAHVLCYYNSDTTVDRYYWDIWEYNGRVGRRHENEMQTQTWDHFGFIKGSTDLKSLYDYLQYGPVVIKTYKNGNKDTNHFAVLVAYTGNGSSFNNTDFVVYDYQFNLRYNSLEYTLDKWLENGNQTLFECYYKPRK